MKATNKQATIKINNNKDNLTTKMMDENNENMYELIKLTDMSDEIERLIDVFDRALSEVFRMLGSDCFLRYKISPNYQTYIKQFQP